MQLKGINSRKSRILIYFLVLAMLVGCLSVGISARARTVKIATVSLANATFRSEPKVQDGNEIGYLVQGDSGEVLNEAYDSRPTPVLWYQATINGKTGWVSSACVTVTERVVADTTVTPDGDFEAYLTAQGFPESYKAALRQLHAQYPNWVFKAQHVNMDWDYVVDQESVVGKSLIWYDSPTSWKSTEEGAYNWETNTWTPFDGSSKWNAASREIVAYFMDPRNFLDSTYIFQFLKQSYDADSMTSSQIAAKRAELVNMVTSRNSFLKGTYKESETDSTIKNYVDTIMSAAASSGVDPLMLGSMIMQEQGTGTSDNISGTHSTYPGLYNYFNIGAFADSRFSSATTRGLWWAGGQDSALTSYKRPWNTRTKSIIGGAEYYGTGYVNQGQDTMYLKKFNVDSDYDAFTHQYMTNVQGASTEGRNVASGYDENAREAALVFKIPVYKSMPSEACPKPTSDANPNSRLKALAVSGYSLTPTFATNITSYSVIVPNSVSSVSISATPVVSATQVSGTGTKSLAVGTNTFIITTKAQSGATDTYTVKIVRQAASGSGGSGGSSASVSVSSSTYKMNSNNTITGITSFPITAANFQKNFSVSNGKVQITNSKGTVKSGNVGTGDQVRVYDSANSWKNTYNVVIYGDVNGDGKVNALDTLVIQKHIVKISQLSGAYSTAADVNKDGRVQAVDTLMVQKHIVKIQSIKQ